MNKITLLLCLLVMVTGCASQSHRQIALKTDVASLTRVKQHLVAPPFLPKHQQATLDAPKVIEVKLTVEEKEMSIGNGAKIQAATFNGSIPGPAIVVHQNDYVELTLENPKTNTMVHSIDLHAVTGALGGGGLTKVKPGQSVVIRFKATKPGVFVYHCAPGGLMIPYHVVSGMNGIIMVLPRDGLKDMAGKPVSYDRAYYIGEQDFYVPQNTNGSYRQYSSLPEAMEDTLAVMKTLQPTHVVFNGAVGALTKANTLQAQVGEKVLFIHSQANRDSRPHLIGGHGDLVWSTGSFADTPQSNLETWFIRGGSAGAMLYEFKQPGTYVYLNHNLIEAVLLGAAAHINVAGQWNDDLLKQVQKPYWLGDIKVSSKESNE